MIVLSKIGNKKASNLLSKTVVHIILVGLIFAIFILAISGRISGRDVKRQVLEKELALLIDASKPGFSFEVSHVNLHGLVDDVRVSDGRIFVDVDGFPSSKGYPYFSRYSVEVEKEEGKFILRVSDG